MKQLKVVLFVAVMAVLVASCSNVPKADIDAANAAFTAATSAQADVYAPESFKAASDANDALTANLTAKDYTKTKELAKALLDAANKAKTDADAAVEVAKTDVATLTTDVNTLLPVVQNELAAAAKAGKKAKVDVAALQASVDAATKVITDTATATNFADSKAQLSSAKDGLTAAQTALEAAGFKN